MFQTSTRFLTRSNFAKKPQIILNVNSAMHRLKAGTIGPEQVSWKKRAILYTAQLDTTLKDSIIYYVEARDSRSYSHLFSLRQIELKQGTKN